MIKVTLESSTYLIYDTKTENSIVVEVSEGNVQLLNESRESQFIFDTDNTEETRARWRNVAGLITKAMDTVDWHNKRASAKI